MILLSPLRLYLKQIILLLSHENWKIYYIYTILYLLKFINLLRKLLVTLESNFKIYASKFTFYSVMQYTDLSLYIFSMVHYNKSGIKYSCLQSYSREKLPNILASHVRPSDRFPASATRYTILDAISHLVTTTPKDRI